MSFNHRILGSSPSALTNNFKGLPGVCPLNHLPPDSQ
jgi:hypothetical protein